MRAFLIVQNKTDGKFFFFAFLFLLLFFVSLVEGASSLFFLAPVVVAVLFSYRMNT